MTIVCIFSDAYLTTVPAKKRRLADARKPVEGSTGDNVQRALADAIKVTGVKPSTSHQEAAQSLARNTNVEKTLEVSSWKNSVCLFLFLGQGKDNRENRNSLFAPKFWEKGSLWHACFPLTPVLSVVCVFNQVGST